MYMYIIIYIYMIIDIYVYVGSFAILVGKIP